MISKQLLNQIINALDMEHLRALVHLFAVTTEQGESQVIEALADQEKF